MSTAGVPDASDLEAQAIEFATSLTVTVRAVVPDCDPFEAKVQPTDSGGRIVIQQNPDTGIPLRVEGESLLTLKVSYYCSWDAPEQFLAVDESEIKVFAGSRASGEPLFRYEFMRWPTPDVSGAHIQVHAHRDAITYVMSKAGRSSRRGRSLADSDVVPRLSKLHFPLGGPRFRPCLEDVLEMPVVELGVDHPPGGRQALQDGRQNWRRLQLATATRDNPRSAIAALTELGYEVTWRGDGAEPQGTPTKTRCL